MAFERISVDPARMGGLPTIRDTRVTVGMVLGQLAAEQTIDDVLANYPYLERDDVLAALEYAGRRRQRARGSGRPSRVRLLVDANLSPRVADGLRDVGFDATHVADIGLLTATDDQIFDHAVANGLVVVTADSDFGMLLAQRRATSPSVVHLRHVAEHQPKDHLALLIANLKTIEPDLDEGAIASLSPSRLAVRDLPLP